MWSLVRTEMVGRTGTMEEVNDGFDWEADDVGGGGRHGQ